MTSLAKDLLLDTEHSFHLKLKRFSHQSPVLFIHRIELFLLNQSEATTDLILGMLLLAGLFQSSSPDGKLILTPTSTDS